MSRFAYPILGPPRWRALVWFWVFILTFGVATVSVLQALGPPSRHSERTVISNRPAEPVSIPRINNHAPPSSLSDRAVNSLPQTTKDTTTAAHRAVESVAQLSALLSRRPPIDLDQAMDAKLQLYELAQTAAAAGNFEEANKALVLATKLDLHLPNSAPARAVAESTSGEGLANSAAIASQRDAHTRLLQTPPPSGRDSRVIASGVPIPPTLPAQPIKDAEKTPDPVLIIHFSMGPAHAPTEAHQLAVILGSRFYQIKLVGEHHIWPNAIIQYYYTRDHSIARSTGEELGRMGYPWQLKQVTGQRQNPRPILLMFGSHPSR
jgi:hypothetical protein